VASLKDMLKSNDDHRMPRNASARVSPQS